MEMWYEIQKNNFINNKLIIKNIKTNNLKLSNNKNDTNFKNTELDDDFSILVVSVIQVLDKYYGGIKGNYFKTTGSITSLISGYVLNLYYYLVILSLAFEKLTFIDIIIALVFAYFTARKNYKINKENFEIAFSGIKNYFFNKLNNKDLEILENLINDNKEMTKYINEMSRHKSEKVLSEISELDLAKSSNKYNYSYNEKKLKLMN